MAAAAFSLLAMGSSLLPRPDGVPFQGVGGARNVGSAEWNAATPMSRVRISRRNHRAVDRLDLIFISAMGAILQAKWGNIDGATLAAAHGNARGPAHSTGGLGAALAGAIAAASSDGPSRAASRADATGGQGPLARP